MYRYVLCRSSFSPITEKYSLYFVFHSASDQMHDPSQLYFQTSGPRAEQVPNRGGPTSSLFRKITQQYILPLEYAISANFHYSKRCLMAFGPSYNGTLPHAFLLSFYNNIKVQVSGVISCISGGISFPRFPDGIFSKIQWG